MPNVGPYIYDVSISGFTRSSIYIYDISSLRVKTLYQSADPAPVFQFEMDFLGSHRGFRDRKYVIYQKENSQFPVNNLAANGQWECLLKRMAEYHQVLALRAVHRGKIYILKSKGDHIFSVEQVTRIGIVQVSYDGKSHLSTATLPSVTLRIIW